MNDEVSVNLLAARLLGHAPIEPVIQERKILVGKGSTERVFDIFNCADDCYKGEWVDAYFETAAFPIEIKAWMPLPEIGVSK